MGATGCMAWSQLYLFLYHSHTLMPPSYHHPASKGRIIPCAWRQRNVVISNQKTPRLIRKKQSRQAIPVCLIKRRSWQIVEGLSAVNYSTRFASRPVLYQAICIFQINHFIKCSPCERKVYVVLKEQAKFYICQRLRAVLRGCWVAH